MDPDFREIVSAIGQFLAGRMTPRAFAGRLHELTVDLDPDGTCQRF